MKGRGKSVACFAGGNFRGEKKKELKNQQQSKCYGLNPMSTTGA